MKFSQHLLIIDDEKHICNSLKELFVKNGFKVTTAFSAKEGFSVLQKFPIDLIICDIVMADMSGITFLEKIGDKIPVVMITAYGSIETTRKAFKLGACDYLVKPFDFHELLVVVKQNLQSSSNPNEIPVQEVQFQSDSAAYNNMISLADKFCGTDMPVLLTGESGVGKEVLANYFHNNSPRSEQPLISINCAAIPDTLLESELFGYEKGAFSGADGKKTGKFEEADGGTIFLDEIGDMLPSLQAKMLRVLQNFEFSRLGGHQIISVDVRIIAASNKDIAKLVEKGTFRADLFHRLNGVHIEVPPLRKRKEDIRTFTDFFINYFNDKYSKAIKSVDSAVLNSLQSYSWPGNIRELKNCIERAVVVCEGSTITQEHLPNSIVYSSTDPDESVPKKLTDYRNSYMREIIIDALRQTGGNRSEAAKLLDISRKTLYLRMKELQIEYEFK
jgi:two-component system, NtrC family, response regulator AtoC